MVVTDEQVGQRLWQDMKAQVLGMAKQAGPGPGQKPLTPEEELLMWNQVAKGWTIDKELELLGYAPDGVTPLLDPMTGQPVKGKSREEVGDIKHPNRPKMAKQGERYFDKYEQFKYYDQMAKRTDPTYQTPVPQGAQEPTLAPPTDPMAPPPHPLVSGPPPMPEPVAVPPEPPYGGLTNG